MTTSRTVRLAVLAGSAGLLASGLIAAPAWAEEISCTGSLGAVTVDNVLVPKGTACTLAGTVVQGTIVVEANASLLATGITVVGNVQAENAASVVISDRSRIGGSVQVKQGGSAMVTGSMITGDIQYDENSGGLTARSNSVGGSIQVVGNSGGAQINGNTINGNLQCKENYPAPTGAGNVVGGNAEDQCRQMVGALPVPGAPAPQQAAPVPAPPVPVPVPAAPAPAVPGASTKPPVAGAPMAVVKVKPVSRRGKLHVNVNPDKGSRSWTFQVQRLTDDGTWGTSSRTYRTSGRSETRTLNLKKGTYRVLVNPQYGHQGVASGPVSLRR